MLAHSSQHRHSRRQTTVAFGTIRVLIRETGTIENFDRELPLSCARTKSAHYLLVQFSIVQFIVSLNDFDTDTSNEPQSYDLSCRCSTIALSSPAFMRQRVFVRPVLFQVSEMLLFTFTISLSNISFIFLL